MEKKSLRTTPVGPNISNFLGPVNEVYMNRGLSILPFKGLLEIFTIGCLIVKPLFFNRDIIKRLQNIQCMALTEFFVFNTMMTFTQLSFSRRVKKEFILFPIRALLFCTNSFLVDPLYTVYT
jgi:hypothetical protein